MLKWQKKKNTAKWRYEKLTGDDAEKYRESENTRVKRTKDRQRENIISAASGDSTIYEHIPDSPKTRSKEKSRNR